MFGGSTYHCITTIHGMYCVNNQDDIHSVNDTVIYNYGSVMLDSKAHAPSTLLVFLSTISMFFVDINLKVLIHAKYSCICSICSHAVHDSRFLIFPYSLLKEVRLPLKGDELHPVEWVGSVVDR